jgi:transcriptional regulator with XRE-family HTH domain
VAEARKMSMTEIIGWNVRTIREEQGLTLHGLQNRLQQRGWSASYRAVAQMESGKRLTVEQLVALSLALGVSPHLLMYPPPGTEVKFTEDVAFPGLVVAQWLRSPDDHPLSTASKSEQEMWFNAVSGSTARDITHLEELVQEEARRAVLGDMAKATRPSRATTAKAGRRKR